MPAQNEKENPITQTNPVADDEAEAQRFALPTFPVRIRSAALVGLFLLAILYTGYLAAPIVVPIVGAILLNFLFGPVVAAASRRRIPRIAAAAALVGFLLMVVLCSLYWLADPAAEWLRTAPGIIDELRSRVSVSSSTLTDVRAASEAVEEAVDQLSNGGDSAERTPQVEIREPGLLRSVMDRMPTVLGGLVLTMFLTFLLLASSDRFLRKLTSLGQTFTARRRIVVIVRQMEYQVAHYLATVTIINLLLGCAVAGIMTLYGLPNPLLWGALATLLNFAPYLGPAITTVVIFLVGINEFETLSAAFLPSITFLVITSLEGQMITPLLLGERLDLSPVVVFVSVVVLGWMWGMVGALMAVPVMATVKICLVNIPRTRALGYLLGR